MNKNVRVRIAPSPTGIPHIGNTRTALYNFLFARHNKGKFLLRLEDTDRKRLVEESEKAIREILTWLGLTWDEEYKQSERLGIYKKHAEELIDKDLAYKDEGAVRFRMPREGNTKWVDKIGNKHISFDNKTQEDFVILKSDGYPTYNFANVIDDHLMNITHVIRGDEFISSTPKHIQLYNSFGWSPPIFVHLPVILGPDHQKLSKRHGAESILDYRDEGYLKEALLNFMALLGWNPGKDRELINLDEMIKLFDLKDVNTASPIFDIKKLEWMNGVYIRNSQLLTLNSKLSELYGYKDDVMFEKLVSLAQSRMATLSDFKALTKHFYEEPEIDLDEKENQIAKDLFQDLKLIQDWKKDEIFKVLKDAMTKHTVRMPVLYKIVTGAQQGLPLPDSIEILGKEKTLKRLHFD